QIPSFLPINIKPMDGFSSSLPKIKERMDARLSNTEICLANLRSLQKSMEGFSSSLPKIKERMDARLSSMQNCAAILQYSGKSMEGFS
ncbi:MAG: hypothetical protein II146_06845, partial [Treponema sp.]|nr:hypothetical protein [Treponema sp.]